MQTLLKLAATALLAWAATAPAIAAPPAHLSIVSERGQAFSLVLDGRLMTRPLARQVQVGQLLPGRHWADISVPTAYGPPMRFRTAVWLVPGAETDYLLAMSPYGPQLRQLGTVPLGGPAYGPGGYGYPGGSYPPQPGGYYGGPTGQLQPQGGYYGNGQQGGYPAPTTPYTPPALPNAPNGGQGNYPGSGPYSNGGGSPTYPNGGQPGGYHNGGSTPTYPNGGSSPTYPNSGQPGPSNGGNSPGYPAAPAPGTGPRTSAPGSPLYPNSPDYPSPRTGQQRSAASPVTFQQLSPDDAADLTQAMRQRPTDDDRLDLAKQTLDESSVRSEDLAALVSTLENEDARVELAEFGYSHVTDPQNFTRVYATFRSSASPRQVQQDLNLPQR